MKYLIIAIITIIALTFIVVKTRIAKDDPKIANFCYSAAVVSKSYMKIRQTDISRKAASYLVDDTLDRIPRDKYQPKATADYFNEIMDLAYEEPRYHSDKDKQDVLLDFSYNTYATCKIRLKIYNHIFRYDG